MGEVHRLINKILAAGDGAQDPLVVELVKIEDLRSLNLHLLMTESGEHPDLPRLLQLINSRPGISAEVVNMFSHLAMDNPHILRYMATSSVVESLVTVLDDNFYFEVWPPALKCLKYISQHSPRIALAGGVLQALSTNNKFNVLRGEDQKNAFEVLRFVADGVEGDSEEDASKFEVALPLLNDLIGGNNEETVQFAARCILRICTAFASRDSYNATAPLESRKAEFLIKALGNPIVVHWFGVLNGDGSAGASVDVLHRKQTRVLSGLKKVVCTAPAVLVKLYANDVTSKLQHLLREYVGPSDLSTDASMPPISASGETRLLEVLGFIAAMLPSPDANLPEGDTAGKKDKAGAASSSASSSEASSSSAADLDLPEGAWQCHMCTLINMEPDRTRCDACSETRLGKPVKTLREVYDDLPGQLEDLCDKLLPLMARVIPMCSSPSVDPLVFEILTRMLSCLGPGSGADCSHGLATSLRMLLHEKKPMALRTGALRLALTCLQSGADVSSKEAFKEAFVRHGLSAAVEQLRGGGGVVTGKSPPTLFLGFQGMEAGLPPSALLDADLFIIACKANTRPAPTATNSRSKKRKVETTRSINALEDLKTIAHALKAEAISAEFAAAGIAVIVPVIEVSEGVSKADGKKRAPDEGVEVEMPERLSVTASLQSLADILLSNDGASTYELEASGVLEALCAYLVSIIPTQDEAGVWKASGRDSGLHTFLSIFLTPANGSQTTPMASLVYHTQEALSASTDCFQVVRHCGATEEDRYKALLSTISVRIAAAAETLSTPEGLRLIDASKGAGCTLSVDALKPIGMLERYLRNHFQAGLDQLHINEHMNERRAVQAAAQLASAAAASAAAAASTSAPPAPQRQRPQVPPPVAAALAVPVPSSQHLRRSPRNPSAATSFEAPVKKRKASRGGGSSSSNEGGASSSAPAAQAAAPAAAQAAAPAAAQADGAAESSDTETIATRLRKRPRRGGDVLPDFNVISLPPATRNTSGRRSSRPAVPEPTPVVPPVAPIPPVAEVPVPAAVVVKSEAVPQVKKAPPLTIGAQVYVYESITQLRAGAIYLPATVVIIHPADTSGSANTYTGRKEEGNSYTVKTVANSVYTHVHISQLKAKDPSPSVTGELTLVCADHHALRCNTCAHGASCGHRGGPPVGAQGTSVPNHIPGFTHPERPGNRARLNIQIPAPPAIAAPAPEPSPAVAPSRNSRRGKAPKAPAKSKGRGAAKSKPAAKAKAVAATASAGASAHGAGGDVRQAKGGSAAGEGGGGSSSGTGGAVPEARGAGRMNVVERAPAPPMPLAEMSWKLLCSDRSAARVRLDLSELPKTATLLEAVQKLLAKASLDTVGVPNGHRNVTVTKEHCDQQYILEYSPKRSTPSASSSASRVGGTTRDITFLPASAKVSGAVVHARNTVMSATGSLGGPAANLLLLLKALCTPDSTRTALDDVDAATLASIQSRCVSQGLSRKVMYQSSEAMAVAAEVMPTWCQIAASSYADLLALDARTAYLKRTTYGKARAVEWLQNSASIVAPHASSGRGSGAALGAHARMLATQYGMHQQQMPTTQTLAEDLRTLGDVRRFQVTLRRSEVLEAAGILMTSLVEGLAAANARYGPAAAAVLTRPSRRVGDMGGGGGAAMVSLGMGGAFLARANDLMFAGGGGGAGAFADANESDDGSDSEYEGDGGAGAAAAAFANAMMEEEAAAVQANANRVNGLQELDKESLEYQLTVDFEGETGHGAGPTLEFFSLVSHELQKKKLDVWHESDTGAPGEAANSEFVSAAGGLYPKPVEQERLEDVVKQFRFMGRFIAKAMKDSMLLDLPLSVPLAKMLVGEHTFSIEDVSSIDASLGRCLRDLVKRAEKMNSLRQNATSNSNTSKLADMEAEIDGMCLSWCLPAYPWYIITQDEKGEAASVQASELEEYVSAVVKHMLDVSVRPQLDALVAGFGDVFDVKGLSACSAVELTELISGGSNQEYWRASTILSSLVCNHGYTRASQQVISLANVMSQLTPDQQRKFLSFVTGSPRLPVGGFHALQPRLTVVRSYSVDQSPDQKLPSCSTCQVYLKLPEYSSEDILREKLLLAITEGRNHFALD